MPQAWMCLRERSKQRVLRSDANRRHSLINGVFVTSFHFVIPTETGSKPFTGHCWRTRLLRNISGFRAGALGMGHVVLMVADFDAALAFYQGLLGFRISDFMREPKACFLHVNARHHSLALFGFPRQGMHHVLMELYSLDDVGQGYDLARTQGDRVKVSLGRHNNDYMTSFYLQTPSNFLIEYGWGGREVDVATWQPKEMDTLASFWGHDGLRQAIRGDAPPPEHLPPPPPEGRRAPLQVMEGNYQRLSGVCPWWDAIAGR